MYLILDLEQILILECCQAGNGLYYFLNTTIGIPKAFGNVIGGLFPVVGQNIENVNEGGQY